jgi:undecaprenyl-diphosphatase
LIDKPASPPSHTERSPAASKTVVDARLKQAGYLFRMLSRTLSAFLRQLLRLRREPLIPVLVLLIAGGLWGFAEIADGLAMRDEHHFDQVILLAMRAEGDPLDPLGPPWVKEMVRDLTALGGFTVLTLLTVVVTGFLLFLGNSRNAVVALVAVAGGVAMTHFLKEGFDRPRPDLVSHQVHVSNPSFPSGHATMAAVVYLSLGVLFARSLPRRRLRAYVIFVSAAIATLVGISRIYLGVHWPTDVLAGLALGSAWALMCWLLAIWLDARRGPSPTRPVTAANSDD